jgi:hypothetical protein
MTVAVAVANAAVTAMNEKLGMLILRNLAPALDGRALRIVHGRRAFSAFRLNGPSILVRYDVLVTSL